MRKVIENYLHESCINYTKFHLQRITQHIEYHLNKGTLNEEVFDKLLWNVNLTTTNEKGLIFINKLKKDFLKRNYERSKI